MSQSITLVHDNTTHGDVAFPRASFPSPPRSHPPFAFPRYREQRPLVRNT
ncbi:MAG: hypothetical protein IKX24_12050 [Prevotella sp.]|nr:hypothetical protein [Prevotella sp.]